MKALVAGIGNIFNRDDGFGVEVAQRLAGRPLPEGVRVEDFGIRSLHLALELLEGYDLLILVDALSSAEPAGTIVVLEPDTGGDADEPAGLDAHRMDPRTVLAAVAGMGGRIGEVVVVGCQPADTGDGMGLSAPVAGAVDAAVRLVEELIADRSSPCVV
jgi:hydrogenase maturation protease